MDMSQTPVITESETSHHTVDPKAERRAEIIGFGIVAALIAILGVAFLAMGLNGVGLVAVALVPVMYTMLLWMAGGKG